MVASRIVVQLLINNGKLVKTRKFRDAKYVGDPLNAIKVFNEKGADELAITDMTATRNGINFDLIQRMATEAFMPVCYGGGIKSVADARTLFNLGVEKVCLTSAALTDITLINQLVQVFGSQSIVVNINFKRGFFAAQRIYDAAGRKTTRLDVPAFIKKILGADIGELILTDGDRDGELCGLNFDLLRYVEDASMPVILNGGMRDPGELINARHWGASAVMGGSCFVFSGPHRAVLISYPGGGGFQIMKDNQK